jgi:hypothetical protein
MNLKFHQKVKILKKAPRSKKYNLVILISPHNSLKKLGVKYFESLQLNKGIFFDVKSTFGNSTQSLSL